MAAKRKRPPDKDGLPPAKRQKLIHSNRRKRPQGKREAVVKMCLKKHLHNKKLLPLIDEMVDVVSRRSHRASLLLNHYVISCLERGDSLDIDLDDQMLYNTALNIELTGKKYPKLREFYTAHRELYEEIPTVPGMSRPLNSAARHMKTVSCNYLWMLFPRRVENAFFSRDDTTTERDHYASKSLLWQIRNMPRYSRHVAFPQRYSDVVSSIREAAEVLGEDEITDTWIVKNGAVVLGFLYKMLCISSDAGRKMFTLLPVFNMKCHHITIDGSALRDMLVRVGDLKSSISSNDFLAMRDAHFRSVFNVRSSWELGNEIKTDGVSLCVNVWRNEKISQDKDSEEFVERFGSYTDYFATDPGERDLAATIHAIDGGEASRCRLTMKQYRKEGHLNRNLRKRQRYDSKILLGDFANKSIKTPFAEEIEEYLVEKKKHYAALWEHHAARKTSAWRMDTYIHKWSCVDRFWRKTKNSSGSPRPLMKYGAASVSSQGVKNRQSGPSKMMRHSCEKHFVVVNVDEYRTTKCCRDCHAITKGVTQKFIGPLKEGKKRYNLKVRGLRRCESNECRSCPLKPRDYAAAWNIGVCWPTRPPAMSRSRA